MWSHSNTSPWLTPLHRRETIVLVLDECTREKQDKNTVVAIHTTFTPERCYYIVRILAHRQYRMHYRPNCRRRSFHWDHRHRCLSRPLYYVFHLYRLQPHPLYSAMFSWFIVDDCSKGHQF